MCFDAPCSLRGASAGGPVAMADAIVIGAGHNGLVAANVLADAGWSVLVVEARPHAGGAVHSAALTIPGYRHDVFSAFYPLAVASPVMRALELERYGLTWRRAPLVLAHPQPDGRCAVLSMDLATTCASLDTFHAGDGEAWQAMIGEWREIADLALGAIFRPFPPLVPLARLLGRVGVEQALRLARHALLPVRRMATERFAGEGAALLLAGLALHSDLSPESTLSAAYGWLLACLGQTHGFPVPEGGAAALTDALVRRLEARGAVLQCASAAKRVIVRSGRAVAVRLQDGTELPARRAVLAAVAAPILYGTLLDTADVPAPLRRDLRNFEWDHGTVKIDWALDAPVPWDAPEARRAGTVHVAEDLDDLTRYSAQLASGQLPDRPFLVFGQQAVADPTRAPAGHDTAWAYTRVPRRLRRDAAGALDVTSGWLEPFAERIEEQIARYAPGFRSRIVGRHVLGPAELEELNPNLVGGAINGGTAQLHQQLVWRPLPGLGRAATPVANLYLASSSAHPGGGVHGAPGANAARAALRRRRR